MAGVTGWVDSSAGLSRVLFAVAILCLSTIGSALQSTKPTATPTLVSLTLDPKGVGGGASTTGEITLSGPAPEGGVLVTLSSSKSAAQVQSSVKVPVGKTSATFAVSTVAVDLETTAKITATFGKASQSESLSINPLTLASISVHPETIKAGGSATGVIELNAPAGVAGRVITVTCDNSSVTVPATVTISSGHSSATFEIKTAAGAKPSSINLTATLGSATKTAALTVSKAS